MYSDDESYNGPTMDYEEYDGSRPFSEYKIDYTLMPLNPDTSGSVPSFTITVPIRELSTSNAAMVPPRLELNGEPLNDVSLNYVNATIGCSVRIPQKGEPSIHVGLRLPRTQDNLSKLVYHVLRSRHSKDMSGGRSEAMAAKHELLEQELQEGRSHSGSPSSESIKMLAKHLAETYRGDLIAAADELKADVDDALHKAGWQSMPGTDKSLTVQFPSEVVVGLDIEPDVKQSSDVQ